MAGGQGGTELASLAGDRQAGIDARRAYQALIQAFLERHKRYPRRAQARGREGLAVVTFVVARSGEISDARITERSGVSSLDRETLAMLRRAGRLPPIPKTIADPSLTFVFPVAFSLR